MPHEATGFWARGTQMSSLGWFNRLRVMDASFPHDDVLFATIIQGPEAGGRVKPKSCPPNKEIWCGGII